MENKKRGLTKPPIGVIIICASVIIIGVAVVFGNRFFKTTDPQTAVSMAFAKTLGEIKAPPEKFMTLFTELYNGSWRQDVTLGVNRLGGDQWPVDAQYLSVAEMLTLKNTMRRDTEAKRILDTLSLQFAASTLAEIVLECEPDRMSFNIPQAFDYYIAVDPTQVTREWDASLLGRYVTTIDGTINGPAFHDYYKRLLFTTLKTPDDTPGFITHIGLLTDGAEYRNMEKETVLTPKGEQSCDAYGVSVTEDALNAYWRRINPASRFADGFPDDLIGQFLTNVTGTVEEIQFEGGMELTVLTFEGKIVGMRFDVQPVVDGRRLTCTGFCTMTGELANLDQITLDMNLVDETDAVMIRFESKANVSDINLFFLSGTLAVSSEKSAFTPIDAAWRVNWDRKIVSNDNFEFSLSTVLGGDVLSIAVEAAGMVTADHNTKQIDARLKRIALIADTADGRWDASWNINWLLRTDQEVMVYNESETVPLTKLGELAALSMYGRIMSNPQLNMLFDNVGNVWP